MTYQRNETPEPLASGAEFEALMPEPAAWCEASNPVSARAFSWPGLGKCREHTEPLYTADQLRKAMSDVYQAATERAAKVCDQQSEDHALFKNTQAAIGCDGCADAIRGTT